MLAPASAFISCKHVGGQMRPSREPVGTAGSYLKHRLWDDGAWEQHREGWAVAAAGCWRQALGPGGAMGGPQLVVPIGPSRGAGKVFSSRPRANLYLALTPLSPPACAAGVAPSRVAQQAAIYLTLNVASASPPHAAACPSGVAQTLQTRSHKHRTPRHRRITVFGPRLVRRRARAGPNLACDDRASGKRPLLCAHVAGAASEEQPRSPFCLPACLSDTRYLARSCSRRHPSAREAPPPRLTTGLFR